MNIASTPKYEETRRIARVLRIISSISARPRYWTRRALAAEHEVSERRIQSDLQLIQQGLRFPLAHSRQGYYFLETRALPAVNFAFGEAVALLLAASVGRATAGVDSAELAAGLARLNTAFPAELRPLLNSVSQPPEEWGANEHRRRLLEQIQTAIATKERLLLGYRTASRGGELTWRQVDPYALVPYVRSFHLVGYCHLRKEVRIFKVDRIAKLEPTGKRFELPEDFDLAEYMGASWGLLRGGDAKTERVRVRFSARTGRWVSEERWHATQKTEWQPDGTLIFSVQIGITPDFVRWLLYYADEARVLEPAWLAEEVARQAATVVASYQTPD